MYLSFQILRGVKYLNDDLDDYKTIRCDNGPEYVSSTIQTWANKKNILLRYSQSGKPIQNSYVEHYNRTVRYYS